MILTNLSLKTAWTIAPISGSVMLWVNTSCSHIENLLTRSVAVTDYASIIADWLDESNRK